MKRRPAFLRKDFPVFAQTLPVLQKRSSLFFGLSRLIVAAVARRPQRAGARSVVR